MIRLTRGQSGEGPIDGGPGNDTLTGGPGDDIINGLGGNDLIEGGAGADTIDGGTGTDTIGFSTSLGGVTVDLRLGLGLGGPLAHSAGDTYFNVENVDGSAYDDTITPGVGANEIDGRGGSDHVRYFDDDAALTASLTTGIITAGGSLATGDRLIRIERLSGTNLYADDLTGSFDANFLYGHGGDDALEGLAGADHLDGGAGTDTARYDSSNSGVTVNLTTGTGSGGHAQGDTLVNIENLIGSFTNDHLTGNPLANRLEGGDGFDTLIGLAGDDVFVAGRGADQMDGGAGTDTFQIAGSSLDTPFLPFTVNLQTGTDTLGNSFTSIETVLGGSANDMLTGDAADNLLDGGAGDDTLRDGPGADILRGGPGHDTMVLDLAAGDFQDPGDSIDGGSGMDTLRIGHVSGTHIIDLEAGLYTRQGLQHAVTGFEHVDGDTLASTGSFDLRGTSGHNILTGGSGDDVIAGRGGADVLAGGAGQDTLSYAASPGAVTVDLASGSASGGDATADSFSGFEALLGSAFGDDLSGDDTDNILQGGAGADILHGRDGLDALYGMDGDDQFWLAGGAADLTPGETYEGGDGTDMLVLTAPTSGDRALDLTTITLTEIETLAFFTDGDRAGDLTVTLGIAQAQSMGLTGITVLARQGGEMFTVNFAMDGAAQADLGALLPGFGAGPGEQVALTGGDDAEWVTGTSSASTVSLHGGADTFEPQGGADMVTLGEGDDTLRLTAPTGLAAGARYEGGGGTDRIVIAGSGLADLRAATLSGFETLTFAPGAGLTRTALLTGAQARSAIGGVTGNAAPGTGEIVQIDVTGAAGLDLSALALTTWESAAQGSGDLIHITESGGDLPGQTLTGSAGDDLFETRGGDSLIGGAGDDRYAWLLGALANAFDGGEGWDSVDVSRELVTGITADLSAGTLGLGLGTPVALLNVEEVHGTQVDDQITGDGGANILRGAAGADILTGAGGADSVFGGDGDDLLIDTGPAGTADLYDGGLGMDTLQATALQWGPDVLFDLKTGRQTLGPGGTLPADSFSGIENLTVAGAAQLRGDDGPNVLTALAGDGTGSLDNWLRGEAGFDTLRAGPGDDRLEGGFGNDGLYGEAGDDVLIGGRGDDLLDGGAGIDTASYVNAPGRVAVFLNHAPADLGGGEGVDSFVSIENVIGTAFNDRLVGDGAGNRLDGGFGDDVLIGLAGHDTLLGGMGADVLDGLGGDDFLDGGPGGDRLFGLGGNDTLLGGAGDDWIEGGLGHDILDGQDGNDDISASFGSDILRGGPGDDDLRGDGADDLIEGGPGNDRLVGGNGPDRLEGGPGNDVLFGGFAFLDGDGLRDEFVFKSIANGGGGFDIIRDFDDGIDKLDFRQSGYEGFAEVWADAVQDGPHVRITLDFGGLLRINDFTMAELTANDFLF